MDDLHQLFRSLSAGIVFRQVRIDQMLADMILKDLRDEALQGSTTRGGLLEDPRALLFAFDSTLDSLNLPFDALQAIQQFRPVPFDVSHL